MRTNWTHVAFAIGVAAGVIYLIGRMTYEAGKGMGIW